MSEPDEPARRILVFLNPRAGLGGQPGTGPVEAALREAGVEAECRAVDPSGLAASIERAMAGGAPVVGVSGGDGTLLTAANVLAGTDTALALFPTGTLNHFARRLGLSDLAAAARAVAAGRTVRAPLGVMDDHLFLNTATFGLYADVVRRRERLRPVLRKWPAALVAIAETLFRYRLLTVTVEAAGTQVTCETPLVWVGVGAGSFPLVHESPDERAHPELEIVVLRPGSRAAALALLLRIAFRVRDPDRLRRDPALHFLNARHVLIRARRHVGVTLDGEVLRCDAPLYVGVQREALAVRTLPETP